MRLPVVAVVLVFAWVVWLGCCRAGLDVEKMLSSGRQSEAEAALAGWLEKHPDDSKALFWQAVLERSRFVVRSEAPGFWRTLLEEPSPPEGLASACVLGIDWADDEVTMLYYYNALLILCVEYPERLPIRWMGAVMARRSTPTSARRIRIPGRHRTACTRWSRHGRPSANTGGPANRAARRLPSTPTTPT